MTDSLRDRIGQQFGSHTMDMGAPLTPSTLDSLPKKKSVNIKDESIITLGNTSLRKKINHVKKDDSEVDQVPEFKKPKKRLTPEETAIKKRIKEEEKERKLKEKEAERERKLKEKEVERERKLKEKEDSKGVRDAEKLVKKLERGEKSAAKKKEIEKLTPIDSTRRTSVVKTKPKPTKISSDVSPRKTARKTKLETMTENMFHELVKPVDGGKFACVINGTVYANKTTAVKNTIKHLTAILTQFT
jgi:hypothetical protein